MMKFENLINQVPNKLKNALKATVFTLMTVFAAFESADAQMVAPVSIEQSYDAARAQYIGLMGEMATNLEVAPTQTVGGLENINVLKKEMEDGSVVAMYRNPEGMIVILVNYLDPEMRAAGGGMIVWDKDPQGDGKIDGAMRTVGFTDMAGLEEKVAGVFLRKFDDVVVLFEEDRTFIHIPGQVTIERDDEEFKKMSCLSAVDTMKLLNNQL